MQFSHQLMAIAALLGTLGTALSAPAQEETASKIPDPLPVRMDVLGTKEWARIDGSIDRALVFLASQQGSDGAFPTARYGQPGVTSLCVMAMLSRGHSPGVGKYGQHLQRGIDYVLAMQKANGLISQYGPSGFPVPDNVEHRVGQTAA